MLSFNGNKLLTTGGGGMIATDDAALARRDNYLTTQAKDERVEAVHKEVGYNYRFTNAQAAVGCALLERFEEFLRSKRRIAARCADGFGDLPRLTTIAEAPWASSGFWLYTVLIDAAGFRIDSRSLIRSLRESGIEARPLWEPRPQSPARVGSLALGCPVAERLTEQSRCPPSSTALAVPHQDQVIDAVRAAAARRSR